jgi:hypothetical protein
MNQTKPIVPMLADVFLMEKPIDLLSDLLYFIAILLKFILEFIIRRLLLILLYLLVYLGSMNKIIFLCHLEYLLGSQKEKLNLIISKKDEMFSKQEEISNTYKKALSKQKTTTFLYKLLSLLGIVSTTLLIVK